MRDALVIFVVAVVLPFCITRPSVGVLLYSWISYMNPHRLTWGFAYDAPLAQLAAVATLIGLFVSSESKKMPVNTTVVIWVLLLLWMGFTTIFALVPDAAWEGLTKVAKIQLMTFVALYVMGTKDRIISLVWVSTLSLAFYGIKGGIFGIVTRGQYRVWGPAGSFIEDNNSLALALIMAIPLLRFLHGNTRNTYLKWGLLAAMLLTGVAILSSQSRGALVGICAMALFLWLKSNNKILIGIAILIASPAAFYMMPESWHDRMSTIQNYEQDGSAMGRITVWRYTVKLANQSATGAGFRGIARESGYRKYAPDIYNEVMATHGKFRAAHSIWFGMLGQHGWIGLTLFILLGYSAWRNGSWVIRRAKNNNGLRWCGDLAAMLQVSVVGYAATGTFLSMEYFDYFYYIVALLVLLQVFVRESLANDKLTTPEPQPNRTMDETRIREHKKLA
jgi:probable O-glycosylation ligase (exosortase A-associated)